MYVWLTKDKGYNISPKRVNRLYYEIMGLGSVLPGPHTSKPGKGEEHQVYPYLLSGLKIERPNQVWATDITYSPMSSGFMYLVAIIDLYSRYVVSWSI
jgi:putative transposase